MTDGQAVRALLADGVAIAVGHDGDIPLNWVAVVETIDAEGARCLWRVCADGMAVWDAIGLHEYALTKLKGELMRRDSAE